MNILVFAPDGTVSYDGSPVDNVCAFLSYHRVDIVINQIAYSTTLLDRFLASGGAQWRAQGGHIISCLHFDPKNPSLRYSYLSNLNKRTTDYIHLAKATLLHPYYEARRRRGESKIYNHIYDNSDYFVTLSKRHFPYLKSVMRRAEYAKLTAINNPLTFENIADISQLNHKQPVLLVCGRMSEYHKRISLVLKAWKQLCNKPLAYDWELRLVGDGPDIGSYQRYVSDNNLPRVTFFGQCSPESHYDDAALLLVTSSAEGWGLVITEALQRGVVPVVMDSSPVFRDIITNGDNGFLTPDGNVSRFVSSIVKLMHYPHTLRRMQESALRSANRFTASATMPKWQHLITSL
jgi:glycosyltransferase involved in cell wall biosynthesis